MSVPEEKPAKRELNIELLLGLSATFLSLAALIVSIFQTKIAREQQHASVWPYLQTQASVSDNSYDYGIVNKGTGPAIVKKVEWIYGDSVYRHTHEFVFNEIGVQKGLGRSALEPNEVLEPTGGLSLLSVYQNDSLVQVVREKMSDDSFNLRIVYSDIYGNCWQLDQGKTTELASCPD